MKKEALNPRLKAVLIISLVIYLATIFSLSYISDASLALVFVGTIPVLIYLIIFFLFFDFENFHLWISWTTPLILNIAFFYLWQSGSFEIINDMEGPTLTVLNLLISYIINIFFFFVLSADDKEKTKYLTKEEHLLRQHEEYKKQIRFLEGQILHYQKQVHINKGNFDVNLRSIEDKCKAINFVIGRVYSDKKGGSDEIRAKLRIDNELYNSFSELVSGFKHENAVRLMNLLERIVKRLELLETKEDHYIKIKHAQIPAEREHDDTILDVLARNDKDPVKEYHAEAKEVCEKLIKYLRENIIADK